MSTRSRIGMQQPDGSIQSIYCHFDGYLEEVGVLLHTHYQEPAKIAALIALGNLSSLDRELGDQHDFSDRPEGQCTFYGRDRGDLRQVARSHEDEAAFLAAAKDSWAEYAYLYRDGSWVYFPACKAERAKPLADAVLSLPVED